MMSSDELILIVGSNKSILIFFMPNAGKSVQVTVQYGIQLLFKTNLRLKGSQKKEKKVNLVVLKGSTMLGIQFFYAIQK